MKRLLLAALLLSPLDAYPATLTLTIPNSVVARSTTAFCAVYTYQAIIDGQPNPETPIQFTQRIITKFIQSTVVSYETNQAANNAQQAQQAQSTADVSGIK